MFASPDCAQPFEFYLRRRRIQEVVRGTAFPKILMMTTFLRVRAALKMQFK
jgi:hypothetical protein